MRDEAKLQAYFSHPPQDISLADIDMDRLPSHISFIMDGNGRWATAQGLSRTEGHKAGVVALRRIITTAVRLGIDTISAYAFSTENWRRPQEEVDFLMHLFATTLVHELPLFDKENVKLEFWGDIEALPQETREMFEQGLAHTQDHDGLVLALAVNYGARAEIVRAAKTIATEVSQNAYDIDAVDENLFAQHLYSATTPDPELLIRTSGEMRLSNYLLWQLAYTEFYICDKYFPDFDRWDFLRALRAYQNRDRRFGGVHSE